MDLIKKDENPEEGIVLKRMWNRIDWEEAEDTLINLQRHIAIAAIKRDRETVTLAQKKLIRSIEARVLAVRHVCDSATRPGIDGVMWETNEDKMKAAMSLTPKGYIAQPMRFVIVRPKGQKERHVQIPTVYDRAMQALYAFSLDPVSESLADRKSFAYRKGRSAFDIHSRLVRAFENKNPPRFLIKTDVKAFYGSMNHEWLIENIPMEKSVLKQFLKAGHIFCGELFPPDDFGISLGSSLSPILANMVLDNLQRTIYEGLHGKSIDVDYADGDLIRYADDILVTVRTEENIKKVFDILGTFLAARGLKLSEEKSEVFDFSKPNDGFVFLSRHYEINQGTVYSTPSKAAIVRMEQSLQELISPWRGGQKQLIEKINKKLTGWASYHKITEAEKAFRHIDFVTKALLLELCEKVNPKLSREKIKAKYFYKESDGEYVYALVDKPDVKVHRLANTVLITHNPASIRMNPYLDTDYFEDITDERAIANITGKYKTIWLRQNGKCFYCGRKILQDEQKGIVPINPARNSTPKNSAYVHACCELGKAEFYESNTNIESRFDLKTLLTRMFGGKNTSTKLKYYPLLEHFRKTTDPVFTLTFKKIEEIIGNPLCNAAKTDRHYWYVVGDRPESRISYCWLSNGYEICALNFEKKHVVFKRCELKGETVNIPSVFFSRIPPDAKAEVEIMLEYIKGKYGL